MADDSEVRRQAMRENGTIVDVDNMSRLTRKVHMATRGDVAGMQTTSKVRYSTRRHELFQRLPRRSHVLAHIMTENILL